MTSGIIKLSKRECDRLKVLSSAGEIGRTNAEIARAMGLGVRQVQRLKRVLSEEGPEELAHGNRGRRPGHSLDEATRERLNEEYESLNPAAVLRQITVLLRRLQAAADRTAQTRRTPDRADPVLIS